VILETALGDAPPEALDGSECYLVRVGKLGQIGRFRSREPASFRRGARVVCRTQRGVEIGQILGPAQLKPSSLDLSDGRLLRRMTVEDEILWGHLQEQADRAQADCQRWLGDHAIAGLLIDVEPLLDGKTLYFHFLSDVSPEIQQHLDHLAAIYERSVRESKFAQLLEHGCGPGCGTEEAKNGCGSKGGCAVCHVASKCKK
jgi:cell fate regulator YaaT (PSP1 superfamily)